MIVFEVLLYEKSGDVNTLVSADELTLNIQGTPLQIKRRLIKKLKKGVLGDHFSLLKPKHVDLSDLDLGIIEIVNNSGLSVIQLRDFQNYT